MEDERAITVEKVSKYFKKNAEKTFVSKIKKGETNSEILVALENLNFHVNKGEMFGIIGLNGSGKTTLLRAIAGIYQPDKGEIKVKGKIAPLLQIGAGFYNELTARDNIIMYGMLLGLKNEIKDKIKTILKFAELEEYTEMKLKYYSSGMRARLGFSTALQIDPDILLVDEVLSVGDISFREKSFNAFLDFKKKKKTILYCSHNLSMLSRLCDRVLLLEKGKMIMIGKPEEVISLYRKKSSENKK